MLFEIQAENIRMKQHIMRLQDELMGGNQTAEPTPSQNSLHTKNPGHSNDELLLRPPNSQPNRNANTENS